jgi:hypothetical protein
MASSDDSLIDAMGEYVSGLLAAPGTNTPTVRYYLGTWAAVEASDSNLSQVILQGGTWCRFVPKKAHVTGLTAGKTVVLMSSPTVPMHIDGVLVGSIKTAINPSGDVSPPTVPTALAVSSVTTTSVLLGWSASSDDVAVTAYDVFVNGTYRQSSISTTTTVGALAPNTAYTFAVRARDAASNVSALSSSVVGTTDPIPPPTVGTIVPYTRTYYASWSRTYNNKGGNEYDSWYGTEAHQGQYSGGNERSLIGGFAAQDGGTPATDLVGATPTGASIRLTYFHWWSNAGGTAVIGTHSYASAPSSYSTQNPDRWESGGWPRGGTRTIDLGAGVCGEFQSGATRGIMLGPGPSSSTQYYGKAYGAGTGVYVPVLTLTYTKVA